MQTKLSKITFVSLLNLFGAQAAAQPLLNVAKYCESGGFAPQNHPDEFTVEYSLPCWNGETFDANIAKYTDPNIDIILLGGDNTFSTSTAQAIEEVVYDDGKLLIINFWSNHNFNAALPAINGGSTLYGSTLTISDPDNPIFDGLPHSYNNTGGGCKYREHTIAKAGAHILVKFDNGDPALLYWKYGHGYVVEWGLECIGQFDFQLGDVNTIMYRLVKSLLPQASTYNLSVDTTGTGTITGSTIDCGTTCADIYSSGSNAELTATPADGWQFSKWSGDCSGTVSTVTVTMNAAKNCTATFIPKTYTVTPTAGSGGLINPSSATINHGETTTFTVTPNNGYNIASVTGCNGTLSGNTYTTDPITDDCQISAAFSLKTYSVSANAHTGGSISPSLRTVNHGETTTFTITPANGYNTASVTGCNGTLSSNTYTTGTITGACSVSAAFTEVFSPVLNINKTGSGTVSGTGIDCGTDCSESYTSVTPVTLLATPASGWIFSGWSGDCSGTNASTTVTMDAAKTCNALFTAVHMLTVTSDNGTVTGPGILCGFNCTKTYSAGTPVTLTAIPDTGYKFSSWSGSCSGTNVSTTVTMDAAKTCNPVFIPDTSPTTNCLIGTPNGVNFAVTMTGQQSIPQLLTVVNTCQPVNKKIHSVALSGTDPNHFTVSADNCSGETLGYQSTCGIMLIFSPNSEGNKTANLMILEGTGSLAFTKPLSGQGKSNQPPVAHIATPGESYLTFDLDGSGSYDSDGTITRYDWQVTSRVHSDLIRSNAGEQVSFQVTAPGEYTAILTVTDNGGLTDKAEISFPVTYRIRLINLSTRCHIQAGAKSAIAGFIIQGTGSKKVLIRALAASSISPALDLRLTLKKMMGSGWTEIRVNDNWMNGSRAEDIANLAPNLVPVNAADAALLADLDTGTYTAIATPNHGDGIGIVGVDDLDGDNPASRLINISGRCDVQGGDGNAIAGFIIRGNGTLKTLLRGMRVNDALSGLLDPRLQLMRIYPGNPIAQPVEENNNWEDHPRADDMSAWMRDYRDAGILRDMEAGVYTVLMQPSSNSNTGIGVVGVDAVP
jgi:uncharacterized repeat protein (TIGR02543 family)